MSARRTAILGASIGLVTLFVYSIRIPVVATGGFIHPGVIAEIFVAIAFGPLVGGLAGGVGAALADLLVGGSAVPFAPLSFLAHGSTGLIAGWLAWRKGTPNMIAGWIIGGLSQIAIYFLGEATIYQLGIAGAAVELPLNLLQVGVGGLGILLFLAVRSAYPDIENLAEAPKFEEA